MSMGMSIGNMAMGSLGGMGSHMGGMGMSISPGFNGPSGAGGMSFGNFATTCSKLVRRRVRAVGTAVRE